MGGDRGPDEIVAGALEAASGSIQPILYGPAGLDTNGLELVEAADTIGMHEKPVEAVRAKPDSSLVVACRAVGDGQADAIVSADAGEGTGSSDAREEQNCADDDCRLGHVLTSFRGALNASTQE